LAPQGQLITIDPNEETNLLANSFFKRSIYANQIKLIEANALTVIPGLAQNFDLVFIDADKKNYPAYYELVINKVHPGAVIIADNVLWSGKVVYEPMDNDTRILHQFNQTLHHDHRVENLLLPIRDGLMILRKI
jgi:predicted O-methyltransferase YrrM